MVCMCDMLEIMFFLWYLYVTNHGAKIQTQFNNYNGRMRNVFVPFYALALGSKGSRGWTNNIDLVCDIECETNPTYLLRDIFRKVIRMLGGKYLLGRVLFHRNGDN